MVIWKRGLPTILGLLLALGGIGATGGVARAQNDRDAGATPPRLSFVDGEVSFWRPGAEDWSPAQLNTALAAGDSVYAGDGANVELQASARAFIRGGADTEIALDSLDPDYTQFRVTSGHAAFDFRRLPPGQTVEVDTPSAAFTIARSGYYRVDVDDNGTTFIVRQGGAATVIPAGGADTDIPDNQQVVLQGTENVQVAMSPAPDLDPWDRWNGERAKPLAEAPRSAQYVPADVAGIDDLDHHGEWRDEPRYGHVWVPHDVAPDWAPYSTGRWVYDPQYEWTWVDDAPWGWAPYHYGRWVSFGGVWGWSPGPIVAAPVYAPALVSFFGAPGVGVSVGIGLPFVSWCALGFGEPIIPWWGRPGFVGRPSWGGWGGPRIVNNVVINNTRIVNVRNITKYQNVNVHNAVVGIGRGQFGHGRGQYQRLAAAQTQRLRPVHGQLGVRPMPASLVAREGKGRRPPDNLRERPVVATRRPQDPRGRLQAAGLPVPATRGSEPRLVTGRRGPPSGRRAEAPGRPPRGQQPPAPPGSPGSVGRLRAPGAPPTPSSAARGERPARTGRATPPPPPGARRARQPAGPEGKGRAMRQPPQRARDERHMGTSADAGERRPGSPRQAPPPAARRASPEPQPREARPPREPRAAAPRPQPREARPPRQPRSAPPRPQRAPRHPSRGGDHPAE